MAETLGSTLPMAVDLVIVKGSRTRFRSLSVKHLPWLSEDPDANRSLSAFLDTKLSQLFQSPEECKHWEKPAFVRAQLSSAIGEYLEGYGITISPELSINVEQQVSRMATSVRVPDEPWLSWTPFKDYLTKNCTSVSSSSLRIRSKKPVIFSPVTNDAQTTVLLQSQHEFLLSSLNILVNKVPVASDPNSQVVKKGTNKLTLPILPVRYYSVLRKAKSRLQLQFELANGKVVNAGEITAKAATLSGPPVSLFLDMGSTFTKSIQLFHTELDIDRPLDGGYFPSVYRRTLGSLFKQPSQSTVDVTGPESTHEFTESMGLPEFDKQHLNSSDEKRIGQYIGEGVRTLTKHYAQKGRFVASVVWSFPDTDKYDNAEITRVANELCSASVLHNVHVLSDHEALRSRFGGVLTTLAGIATERRADRDEALKKNKENEKRRAAAHSAYLKRQKEHEEKFFLWRWLSKAPEKPDLSSFKKVTVPSLEEWHDAFLAIRPDERLRDCIILDAGGYSLDAYCNIAGKTFGRSFEAGGLSLTRNVREHILQKGRRISVAEAENRKTYACARPQRGSDLNSKLEQWTEELYERPLIAILDWAREHLGSRGVPLILTGGAMNNKYLEELVARLLEQQKIEAIPVRAPGLSLQISESKGLTGNEVLNRFHLITTQFFPGRHLESSNFDVVGGLLERFREDVG